MSNRCFQKIMFFAKRRERLFMELWTRILVSDFKLTRENDDLLSSRYKYIFQVLHPVQEYT